MNEIKLSFKKEGAEDYFILTNNPTEYTGKIRYLGRLMHTVQRRFNLNNTEAEKLQHQIIHHYLGWRKK